ncbi:MAG: GIY-YIG nuclease family protein [Solirubrobacterales bacterium]|nr:GIY-YIG nuclease family protein [Solirubrobacterales bacterium]
MSLDERPVPTGATISLYLADGRPAGIRIVEKDNWNGIGVDCSRSDLARARRRQEFSRSGVYLLLGNEGEVAGLPTLYVGEADDLSSRIPSHGRNKDFWTRVVIFTSKDGSINKAHAKHLEARLCALASAAKRCELDNKIPPSPPQLSDSDRDSAERFLAEMLIVLPAVGVTAFENPAAEPTSNSPVLQLEGKGTSARGQETSEGFRVFGGARARKEEVPSIHAWLVEIRADLVRNGALREDRGGFVLTQDYVFDSPSAAAGVLMGRAANGRKEWRTEGGKTLKELQEEALESA